MKQVRAVLLSLLTVLLCSLFSAAQQSVTTATNASVPPLIPFSSVATDEGGSSLSGVVNITFSLYAAQQGGAPLWTETQNNVQLDPTGHYSAQLGITQPNGVPTTLFTTGEARWLGVRIAEQVEQPRVLLLSVPYALKAGDATTIGGLPPSAFVLAVPPSGLTPAAPLDASATTQTLVPPPTGTTVTGTGTVNFLPLWDATSDIISSVLFQSGTGATAKVGINTTTPATTLDVRGTGTIRGALSLPATGLATGTAGKNSQPLNLVASAFNTTAAVNQTFQLQAEAVNNDMTTASATLNLLFGTGATKPAETGLKIASNGVITFNATQTFPNTLTGVATATGSGLTGGGTSGTLNLGLLTTCTTNQVLQWNGTAWACATVSGGGGGITAVTAGTDLTGGGTSGNVTLNLDTTKVPQLATANVFTGNQTVTGNVIATAYEIPFAGTNYLFDYGTPFTGAGLGNSFLGFAGNATTTGVGNVGAGYAALFDNTTGTYNTALGLEALFTNSSGQQNTAVGSSALFATGGGSGSTGNNNTAVGFKAAYSNNTGYNNTAIGLQAMYDNTGGIGNTAIGGLALYTNTTGNYNTAVGYQAGPTGALTNTTAIGANALVSESNAVVLGGTGSNAVKVGIGTATPAYTLDAAGTIRSSSGGFMFPDGTTQTTAASAGGGTITGVTAGTGLTGGGTTGNVTLNINTATIPLLSAANAFSGTITAGTSSSSSFGVLGESNAASGQNYGVGGLAVSPAGYGVWGLNTASGGIGVYGFDSSGTGVSGSGATYGVYGTATAAGSTGVYGTSTGSGSTVGVYGSGANGVQGSGTAYGVYGNGTVSGVYGSGSYGVLGSGTATGVDGNGPTGVAGTGTTTGVFGNGPTGVYGTGTTYGVYGTGPTGIYGTGTTYGVYGTGPNGVYGTGTNNGVSGIGVGAATGSGLNGGNGISASGGTGDPSSSTAYGGAGGIFDGGANENGYGLNGYGGVGIEGLGGNGGSYCCGNGGDGVYATGGNGYYSGYAGYFSGSIEVTGSISAGTKDFKIDHPLDPANRYLYHSSVESSEMMNIYTGNVTTDGRGLATVQLPDWFEVLNTDFRYQLTVIGQFAQAIVGSKVASHQFSIRTDKPNVEVSWQITGVRQDAYAKAHPLVVEQAKDARERGHYIHPELYGASEEQSIDWARHPEMMKRMQETRARQLAAAQGQATITGAETLPLAVPPTPKAMPQLPSPRVAPVRPATGPKPPVRAELQPLASQPR